MSVLFVKISLLEDESKQTESENFEDIFFPCTNQSLSNDFKNNSNTLSFKNLLPIFIQIISILEIVHQCGFVFLNLT